MGPTEIGVACERPAHHPADPYQNEPTDDKKNICKMDTQGDFREHAVGLGREHVHTLVAAYPKRPAAMYRKAGRPSFYSSIIYHENLSAPYLSFQNEENSNHEKSSDSVGDAPSFSIEAISRRRRRCRGLNSQRTVRNPLVPMMISKGRSARR